MSVSAMQALHWYPKRFFVSNFAGIIAILYFGYNYLRENLLWMTRTYSILLGFGLLICVYLGLYLCFLLKNFFVWCHERWIDSIWTDALKGFTESYTNINRLRRLGDNAIDEIPTSLRNLCDSLKEAFDVLTNSNCCVSIKVPVTVDENSNIESLEMKNLCRDTKHKERDTQEYQEARHTIIGNTAYSVIVRNIMSRNKQKQCYINNDVLNTKDYATTTPNRNEVNGYGYRSEIVYPIMPEKNDAKDISGFICVDSPKANAFKYQESERTMTAAIADGLFDIIEMYLNYQNQND